MGWGTVAGPGALLTRRRGRRSTQKGRPYVPLGWLWEQVSSPTYSVVNGQVQASGARGGGGQGRVLGGTALGEEGEGV